MTTLGGSTLPAAAGLDPFCSPIRLWLELTRNRGRVESEAQWWGKRDETLILERLGELGYRVIPGWSWLDVQHPWLIGHTDGHLVVSGDEPGEPVECKSMAHRIDALDVAHEAQVQTYVHLASTSYGLLARRIGHALEVRTVPRNQHAIDLLLELGERFLEHVKRNVPPPVSGHPDDRHALGDLYPVAVRDRRRRETRAVREARRELRRLTESAKARKAREEHLRAIVTEHLGEAETLIGADGEIVATWRNVESRRFNLDAFKRDHAALYEEYREPSAGRVLRLT